MKPAANQPRRAPRRVLINRTDGYGDMVLFAPFLRGLLEAWPDTEVHVLTKETQRDVRTVLPERIRWVFTGIHPHKVLFRDQHDEVLSLHREFHQIKPDLIISPNFSKTWLDELIGWVAPEASRVCLGPKPDMGVLATEFTAFLKANGFEKTPKPWDEVAVEERSPEPFKNQYLFAHLTGVNLVVTGNPLQTTEHHAARASDLLVEAGLEGGNYALVGPAGTANVSIKAWPPDHFGRVIARLELERGIRSLIIGSLLEEAILLRVEEVARANGATPAVWIGGQGEFGVLVALAQRCRLYFGNDSAPMHVVANFDRPVVAVFGGGAWGRFLPKASRSVVVHRPMPCYHCAWDCIFGDGRCLTGISEDKVWEGLTGLLDRPDGGEEIVEAGGSPEEEARLAQARESVYVECIRTLQVQTREKEKHIQHLLGECHRREILLRRLQHAVPQQPVKVMKRWLKNPLQFGAVWQNLRKFKLLRHLFRVAVRRCPMQLDLHVQHRPKPLPKTFFDPLPVRPWMHRHLPSIALVTPSYQQVNFLSATVESVLSQRYPKLHYVVCDGGSTDGSAEFLKGLKHPDLYSVSEPDHGQADAVRKGLRMCPGEIMAWLNSDDLLLPGTLEFVGEYFRKHPEVDVLYGDRILINEDGDQVGCWVLPSHDAEELRWVDYVPQETMFWRRELWNRVGAVDPSFHFALDWDLLLRYQEAGANIVHVDRFLGCFRIHTRQKSQAAILGRGAEEMQRLRNRQHDRQVAQSECDWWAERVKQRATLAYWRRRLTFQLHYPR